MYLRHVMSSGFYSMLASIGPFDQEIDQLHRISIRYLFLSSYRPTGHTSHLHSNKRKAPNCPYLFTLRSTLPSLNDCLRMSCHPIYNVLHLMAVNRSVCGPYTLYKFDKTLPAKPCTNYLPRSSSFISEAIFCMKKIRCVHIFT